MDYSRSYVGMGSVRLGETTLTDTLYWVEPVNPLYEGQYILCKPINYIGKSGRASKTKVLWKSVQSSTGPHFVTAKKYVRA